MRFLIGASCYFYSLKVFLSGIVKSNELFGVKQLFFSP